MRQILKKYKIDKIIRGIAKSIINLLLKVFWVFPIKEKNILFISYGGKQYSCNPKYISEYLNNDTSISPDIIWSFEDADKYMWLEENNIKVVRYGSIKYLKNILTAKIVVTNNNISSYLPIREKQVVLNTWHGGGSYKKVVSDKNIEEKKIIRETGKLFDIFLSTCEKATEYIIRGTFGFEGKVLEVGYPRNDIFFNEVEDIKIKVYKQFDLDIDEKIVLYAPTFREGGGKDIYDIDVKGLKDTLEKRFGGKWILLVRAHHAIRENFDFNEDSNLVKDATDYPDMQELLASAEILITDYSSCIWDFSLTGKPSILFAKDIESYVKERDFYVPINKWHFPIVRTNKELMDYIEHFDQVESKKNIEKHLQEFGSFETGNATKAVVDEIKTILEA